MNLTIKAPTMTLTRERIKAKALLIDLDGTIVDITEPSMQLPKKQP